MRVGLIVEGWTDYTFLEILIKSRCGEDVENSPLQPKWEQRETRGYPGIQQWLVRNGRQLEIFMKFDGLDTIVLQLDGDVAKSSKPCRPSAEDQWEEVSGITLKWAKRGEWPEGVVLAIMLQKLEAWVCAGLSGCKAKTPQLECEPKPEEHLPKNVQEVIERLKGGNSSASDKEDFRRWLRDVADRWELVLQYCPVGAGRFEQMLQKYLSRREEAL